MSTIAPVPQDLISSGNRGRWFNDLRVTVNSLQSSGGIDHTLLSNIGSNTHAQIDTHIADTTVHYTMLDEDNMASDSNTQAATQQSIKAYVTTSVGAIDFWSRSGTTLTPKTSTDDVECGDFKVTKSLRMSAVETITASSDTLDDSNYQVNCDCSSNAITINLPAVSGNAGLEYDIGKVDSTGNIVTIDPNGSENIITPTGSATTITITNQGTFVKLRTDGTDWFMISQG